MARGIFNPFAVWSQVPIGSRTSTVVKSLQRGVISIADVPTSGTATITAVNTAKSVVLFGGIVASSGSTLNASLVLTDATTVTASTNKSSGSGVTATVPWQVVEFY